VIQDQCQIPLTGSWQPVADASEATVSRNAEWSVLPPMLNAAVPVGADSRTLTASGLSPSCCSVRSAIW